MKKTKPEALTEEQIEEMRGALGAEKDSLEEELASYGHETEGEGDWTGGIEEKGEDADPNDVADKIEELATNVPLVEELKARHKEVVDALERVEKGTYGICAKCKEPIPLDRLEANPAANTCVTHVV